MTGFEKTVSRSQLYDNDDDHLSSDSQEYNLPPPGFDFEIVDVEDVEDITPSTDGKTDGDVETIDKNEIENKSDEDNSKVEFFPLFSSLNGNDSSTNNANLVQIKVDTVEDIVGEESKPIKYKDSEWDSIASERNSTFRPLNYYLQESPLNEIELEKIKSVAVDGETILKFSKQFKIESNYKLIDLKKFNATIDLYYNSDSAVRNKTIKKRDGKKKRDAKIFKKERIKEWKRKLKEAKERARKEKYKQHNENKTSTKIKFGDSFNKRRSNTNTNTNANTRKNININTSSNNKSNDTTKNINKPIKPIFRTE